MYICIPDVPLFVKFTNKNITTYHVILQSPSHFRNIGHIPDLWFNNETDILRVIKSDETNSSSLETNVEPTYKISQKVLNDGPISFDRIVFLDTSRPINDHRDVHQAIYKRFLQDIFSRYSK